MMKLGMLVGLLTLLMFSSACQLLAGAYEVTYVTWGDYPLEANNFGPGTAIADGDLSYSNGTVMAWAYSATSVDKPEIGFEDEWARARAKAHKYVRFDAIWRGGWFAGRPSGTIYHEDKQIAVVDGGTGEMESGQFQAKVDLQMAEVLDYPLHSETFYYRNLRISYPVSTYSLSVIARGYSETITERYWSGWATAGDESVGNPPISALANYDYTWNQLRPILE